MSEESTTVNEGSLSHVVDASGRHRAVQDVAQWFDYGHLPAGQPRNVSAAVATMAQAMIDMIPADDPELTRGLHKLVEAKDCLVRAAIAASRQAGEPADDPADLAASISDLTPDVLRDILLVVGEDIPDWVIAQWTDDQRKQVAEYAAREHLSASDNPVTRLPRPAILGGERA